MAGFPEPAESPYDLFRVGHAGTGISTAVGMARGDCSPARRSTPSEPRRATRRHARSATRRSSTASRWRGSTTRARSSGSSSSSSTTTGCRSPSRRARGAVLRPRPRQPHLHGPEEERQGPARATCPGGGILREAYHRMGEMTKALINEDSWFEKFNLLTVGPDRRAPPPDAHRVPDRGSRHGPPDGPARQDHQGQGARRRRGGRDTFHSPKAFKVERAPRPSAAASRSRSGGRSFTSAFGDAMDDLMERDAKVVACTAAMPDGTGITPVIEQVPRPRVGHRHLRVATRWT
jgi:1-deoxy-D-xylulose-5-phosphate synthase